jgi:type VI protein secretion system component VasF
LSPINDFSVQPIDQRLDALKKRQRHLMIWFVLACTLVVITVASLFLQKNLSIGSLIFPRMFRH